MADRGERKLGREEQTNKKDSSKEDREKQKKRFSKGEERIRSAVNLSKTLLLAQVRPIIGRIVNQAYPRL